MKNAFVHLHLHTEYSILDGLIKLDDLADRCQQTQMPAIAITDHFNLFAMVKFYRKALASGIKPIIGSDVQIEGPDGPKTAHTLTLLCQNTAGYRNLSVLISRAYQTGQHNGVPLIKRAWITPESTQGIIALSGDMQGEVGQLLIQGNLEEAEAALKHWQSCFNQAFYLNIARVGRRDEALYVRGALKLAKAHKIPVVATNAVCMLSQADFEAHEARVCINRGELLHDPQRTRSYTDQQYLRSPEEMFEVFADLPSALENALQIAKRCNLQLQFDTHFLPEFPVPPETTVDHYFDQEAASGLEKRIQWRADHDQALDKVQAKKYWDRLHLELDVIKKMGFPGYFLIVADFIHWAKTHGVPVGPGRGSGAGSLVAYALEITDVDPMTYDLLFERFLNPERVSMPDFDIDFCMEGRDRVIDYVMDKYGRDSVAQIITYGTMAARAVVRDVGRVLAYPYGFVDKLAKLIPFEIGMTLKKALKQEEKLSQLYHEEEEVKNLIQLAVKLEGTPRNVGKHAGGVVIAPSQLTDFTPLFCEPDGDGVITQLDKDDIEAIGLVKFDFLGLRTLTIIKWTVECVNHRKQAGLDISAIPLDDEKTFDLLKACETTAVFQLESRGMRDLVKRLQPSAFDDIVALVALFRPGPLQSGMVDDFIDRKFGRAAVVYPHPDLEPILKSTYGVILYQEQVMQIAQVLANYTLGAADLLRRAMGKKKASEMSKQRAIFMEGAVDRGVEAQLAQSIFDLMEKFAGYGFNKSHSVAYALLAYQTAWLKAHHPAEFMSAVLSSDMDNTDKVVGFIAECKHMGLEILQPDIHNSQCQFTVSDTEQIVYGLGAIKGLGEGAIVSIVEARESGGSFSNLGDLCGRIDTRRVNRRALEALIRAGALDVFEVDRAVLLASIDTALQAAEKKQRDLAQGQGDLFANAFAEEAQQMPFEYRQVTPWSDAQRLQGEKEVLGLYFSGHPIHAFREELVDIGAISIAALQADPTAQSSCMIAGYVTAVKHIVTKNARRIAFVHIEDSSGEMDIGVFGDVYKDTQPILLKDALLVITGEIETDAYTGGYKITANQIYTMEQARLTYAQALQLTLTQQQCSNAPDFMGRLQAILSPHAGGQCPVMVRYQAGDSTGELALGEQWCVNVSDVLLEELRILLEGNVVVTY